MYISTYVIDLKYKLSMSCKLVNDNVPTYDVVKADVTRGGEQWGVVASATVPAIGKVIGHQRQEVHVSVGNNITTI